MDTLDNLAGGADGRSVGQVALVCLDVGPADVGDTAHPGSLAGEKAGELTQDRLDAHHRRRTQRHRHLVQVVEQGAGQPRSHSCPLGRTFGRLLLAGLGGRLGGDSQMEQRRFDPEDILGHHGGGALGLASGVVQRRLDECLATGTELGRRNPIGTHLVHDSDLHQGRPLQLHRLGAEAQVTGYPAEPGEQVVVVTTGHVTYVQTSRHQVLGGGGQSAGDHQPTDDPAVLVGLGALLGQAQLAPPADADAGEEHLRHRDGGWAGEHAGLLQRSPIGADEVFPFLRRNVRRGVHCAAAWVSIASAAGRYSPASQSFARWR